MTRPVPPQEIPFWEEEEESGIFKSKVYDDGFGNPTQGFGHTGPEVRFGGPDIDKAQADAWVAQDLSQAQEAIDHLVTVSLNDNQDAALVDFVGNAGAGALASSTLLRKLNVRDYTGAAEEFLRWTYAKNQRTGKLEYSSGLASRRGKERAMFLMPGSAPVPPIPTPRPEYVPAPEEAPAPDTGDFHGTAPPPLTQSSTIWSTVATAIAGPAGMVLAYVQSPYALIALAMVLGFLYVIYKERTRHRAVAGI